jgi:toxin ParE1/3/4
VKALVFSPAAEADIDEIWNYSAAHWGLEQAERYTDEIRDACHALVSGRRQGRKVDVRPGYLKLSAGSHLVFFRERDERIEVIRVLHGRQDVERHL